MFTLASQLTFFYFSHSFFKTPNIKLFILHYISLKYQFFLFFNNFSFFIYNNHHQLSIYMITIINLLRYIKEYHKTPSIYKRDDLPHLLRYINEYYNTLSIYKIYELILTQAWEVLPPAPTRRNHVVSLINRQILKAHQKLWIEQVTQLTIFDFITNNPNSE